MDGWNRQLNVGINSSSQRTVIAKIMHRGTILNVVRHVKKCKTQLYIEHSQDFPKTVANWVPRRKKQGMLNLWIQQSNILKLSQGNHPFCTSFPIQNVHSLRLQNRISVWKESKLPCKLSWKLEYNVSPAVPLQIQTHAGAARIGDFGQTDQVFSEFWHWELKQLRKTLYPSWICLLQHARFQNDRPSHFSS